jgi:hypothetical protein
MNDLIKVMEDYSNRIGQCRTEKSKKKAIDEYNHFYKTLSESDKVTLRPYFTQKNIEMREMTDFMDVLVNRAELLMARTITTNK